MPLTTCRRGAPFLRPNQLLASNLASNSRPDPTQNTTKSILPAFLLAPLPLPEAFLITPTPFNLHNCLPNGRLPSNSCIGRAPHDVPEPSRLLGMGRIRYSTSVSGQSGRRRRAYALASVRRSNCTCGFPACSFHEGPAFSRGRKEGISEIKLINPSSPRKRRAGYFFHPAQRQRR